MESKQQEWMARVQALLCREDWIITNLANAAAAIWEGVDRINWAGFYLLREGELQLGPFMGKPACVRIPMGRGVCGTAAAQGRTVVVRDVHAFAGHIAWRRGVGVGDRRADLAGRGASWRCWTSTARRSGGSVRQSRHSLRRSPARWSRSGRKVRRERVGVLSKTRG